MPPVRRALSSLLSSALVASGLAAVLVTAGAAPAQAAGPTPVCDASGRCTVAFEYAGAVETWTVPAGVTSINATVLGAGTMSYVYNGPFPTVAGGGGGQSSGTIAVTPGQTVKALVGGAAGFGGGGSGGGGTAASASGSGGSFLAVDNTLMLAAGGSGGPGRPGSLSTNPVVGGAGGGAGAPATAGGNGDRAGGGAATVSAHGGAGAPNASAGSGTVTVSGGIAVPSGGRGGDGDPVCVVIVPCPPGESSRGGGGGGGGYRAGGGGGGSKASFTGPVQTSAAGGGGGGSGYAAPAVTNVSGAAGVRDGNGRIVLTYVALTPQSISFTSPAPTDAKVGGSYTPTATGGASGQPVVFSVVGTPTGACTIDAGVVSFVRAGSCEVRADQAATTGYAAAPRVTQTIAIGKGAGAISFSLPASGTVGGTTTLIASGRSSAAVTFATTSAACSIGGASSTELRFLHVGTCTVTASQAGDADYEAATPVQASTTVGQRRQAITFSLPSASKVGERVALGATSSAGLTVSYAVGSNGVCRIDAGEVVYDHVGTCTVTASQTGDDDTSAAMSVDQQVVVGKGLQSISFTVPGPNAVGGQRSLTATGGASGQPVTYAVGAGTTNDACVIQGGNVVFQHAGVCEVTADQAGTDDYEPAATATQTLSVGKGFPSLSYNNISGGTVGDVVTLQFSSASSGVVTVSTTRPAVCTPTGITVRLNHVGPCALEFSQAETADYQAYTTGTTIQVSPAAQTITGFSAPSDARVGGTAVLSAIGGASGLPVVFAVKGTTTDQACRLDSGTLLFEHAGTCVVTADQAGNADYLAAPQVERSFTVAKAAQAVTGFAPAASGAVGTTISLSASGGGSGQAVRFGIDGGAGSVCRLSGTTLSLLHVGECSLTADQDGNADYEPAPQLLRSVSVVKAAQTVTGFSLPASLVVGDAVALTASGGGSGTPVVFVTTPSTTNSACEVDGTTLRVRHVGTCAVSASQAGTADYERAPAVTITRTVGQGSQAIAFTLATAGAVDGAAALAATGGASGQPVTYAVTTPSVCAIDGTQVLFQHAGECTVRASQAGTADYAAAPSVSQTVQVGKGAQAITFALPPTGTVGGSTTLAATGGPSGASITYAVDGATTASACSIDGSTLRFDHAGSCVVTADQAATADYSAAATATQTVMVGQASQAITFTVAGTAVKGGSVELAATGGGSGLPVTFVIGKSTTNAACSLGGVTGRTLSFDHAGSCEVIADQAGNADHLPAASVSRTITVAKAAQAITGYSLPGSAAIGSRLPLVAMGGASAAPVTFAVGSATTNAACRIVGSDLVFEHAGTCVVAADQAGADDYLPAEAVVQAVSVARTPQGIAFSLPAMAGLGTTAALVASGGGSGQPISFAVAPGTTNGACVVDGGLLRFVHGGTCVVAATQPGTGDFEDGRTLAEVVVERAATTTAVSVTPSQVRALVGPTVAGVGSPSGSVEFLLDGVVVGTAPLNADGLAVLDLVVPAGEHLVVARYLGDGDFAAGVGDYATSSGEVVRIDPSIVATVTSTRRVSRTGWYRRPVTVTFTCTTGSAPLALACPTPVLIKRSTKGRVVQRAILAEDGGTASASTPVLRIDVKAPKVRLKGVAAGTPRCVAKDRISGVASCRIKVRHPRGRTVYVAIAKDRAGNKTVVRKAARKERPSR